MEIQMNEKAKCNCNSNSNCCEPPKGKLWKKILFAAIVLSAVTIVGVKLVGKNNAQEVQKNTKIEQSCCDTTGIKGDIKITNPEKTKSCCKQTKK
ncbi:MAG: hypothetical protein HOO91_11425 [Bacteroidales bacterium]|nr:hypothetical protein [Bacteroidales bacterium]